MLFKAHILEGIAAGRIDRAFRFWKRPTVKAGGNLRVPVGVLTIGDVREISPDQIGEDDAIRAGFDCRDMLLRDLGDGGGRVLYRIDFRLDGADPRIALRQQDDLSAKDIAVVLDELAGMDARAQVPWTGPVLRMIGERDGRLAAEIAEALAIEKLRLKRLIRQLKELGLTESLQQGYRLSPRGRVVLAALQDREKAG